MFNSIEVRRHTPEKPWTYESLDQRQREIAADIEKGSPGVLLLSEVSPVITVGRRTPQSDFLLDRAALSKQGIQLLETDRGGLATYHGRGQWVLFPVDRLERLTGDPRGVRKAVESLLRISEKVANQFGMETETRQGAELGVWTSRGKLSAVGIHVENGVLLHGLSFNVFKTPESFLGIRPCGLDAAVDFLSPCVDEAMFEAVGKALVQAAQREYNL